MSKSLKFTNFDTFQPVEHMDSTTRAQQYAFNGRIYLPSNERFDTPNPSNPNNLNTDYQYRNSGGLIQIEQGESVKPYELYKDSNKIQDTNVNIISNIVVPNALSRTFFSNDNVERIQRQIINEVYRKSQKQIGKQSYQELQIIMKSIYLQYGRNLEYDIEGQVVVLNKYVVDECSSIIIPNVLQYTKYVEDITSPIAVMTLPQSVNSRGYKTYDFTSLIPTSNN